MKFSAFNDLMEDLYKEDIIPQALIEGYHEDDEEFHRSAFSLMKHNNGFFKSPAQSAFMHRKHGNSGWEGDSFQQHIKNTYGIHLKADETAKITKGSMNFNPYSNYEGARAGRGYRPVGNLFTFDKHGITAHYKIKHSQHSSGRGWVESGVEKKWERPATADVGAVEKQHADHEAKKAETSANSSHVGAIGERIKAKMKLHTYRNLGMNAYGGETHMHILRDEKGNLYHHFGSHLGMKEGDEAEIHATVKAHKTDNRSGEKVTLLNRPRKK